MHCKSLYSIAEYKDQYIIKFKSEDKLPEYSILRKKEYYQPERSKREERESVCGALNTTVMP
jgi:hypothetical protein